MGEQLAYIAGLAVGAPLIFGDRPKEQTYERLMTLPSLADLDQTFGCQVRRFFVAFEHVLNGVVESKHLGIPHPILQRQCFLVIKCIPYLLQAALNYKEILSGQPAIAKKAAYTLSQHIMQIEREAVLCQSLHNAAAVPAGKSTFRQPVVVGVVGEAHIEGIAQMWEGNKWRAIIDGTGGGEKYAELLAHGPPAEDACEQVI